MRHAYRFAAVAVAALALSACSDDDEFEAEMKGAKERPTPVDTPATGNATSRSSDTTVTVDGRLRGPERPRGGGPHPWSRGHGDGGPRALPAHRDGRASSGTLSGSCTLSEEQLQQLRDGQMYVNVHTQAAPAGRDPRAARVARGRNLAVPHRGRKVPSVRARSIGSRGRNVPSTAFRALRGPPGRNLLTRMKASRLDGTFRPAAGEPRSPRRGSDPARRGCTRERARLRSRRLPGCGAHEGGDPR